MAWKCPECSQTNDNKSGRCACGYAFYDVLGLKEDASAESVEQTYAYLVKVWESQVEAHSGSSRDKMSERLGKINNAYAVFKHITNWNTVPAGGRNTVRMALAGAAAFVLVIAVILLLSSRKSVQPTELPVVPPGLASAPEKKASAVVTEPAPVQSAPSQPAAERRNDAPDMKAEKTSDWAIESVKKSYMLDRFSTIGEIMNKWTEENAHRLKIIGWIAKKVDDHTYLVTYTATDGIMPSGFFFEIKTDTGEIRNVVGNADLQQKYGIK